MLSRTADHLFWMSRYTERAENTARMLDVNYQTSLLPQSAAVAQVGWQGLLSISELMPSYTAKYGHDITPRNVMDFMVRDESNPSSIVSCLRAARENARAVRGALTTELWETQNATWLKLAGYLKSRDFERDPGAFFEWVKHRSHLSRGVAVGTMLQDEAFHFYRMGSFLERADNTARLLDVKFHAVHSDFFGAASEQDPDRVAEIGNHLEAVVRDALVPTLDGALNDISDTSEAAKLKEVRQNSTNDLNEAIASIPDAGKVGTHASVKEARHRLDLLRERLK